MSVGEYRRSWSKATFVRVLQRLMPELSQEDLVPGASGVRAQALDNIGNLVDDFHFVYTGGMVHVCNVPSPAATASLTIARHIVDIAVLHAGLVGIDVNCDIRSGFDTYLPRERDAREIVSYQTYKN